MNIVQSMVQRHQVLSFLVLTFFLSALAFALMWLFPKWQSPQNLEALPIWLLAVWSPTVSALIVWAMLGKLWQKLKVLFTVPELSPWFLVLLVPLVILITLLVFHPAPDPDKPELSLAMILFILIFNLALGPLGEEAGWRGFLLADFIPRMGWMGAALVVALIWTLWHIPLWFIESPQAEISLLVFTGHVFCYSILMTVLYKESNGSLIPVILFHLLVNVITAYISLLSAYSIAEIYRLSLPYYIGATLIIAGLYELLHVKTCHQIIQSD